MHNILENNFTGEKKDGGNLSIEKYDCIHQSIFIAVLNRKLMIKEYMYFLNSKRRGWSTVTTGFSQKTDTSTCIRNLIIFFSYFKICHKYIFTIERYLQCIQIYVVGFREFCRSSLFFCFCFLFFTIKMFCFLIFLFHYYLVICFLN